MKKAMKISKNFKINLKTADVVNGFQFLFRKSPGNASVGDKVNAFGNKGIISKIENGIIFVFCPEKGITKEYSMKDIFY